MTKNDLGFGFREIKRQIGSKEWTFRELSVEENDECNDAGNGPDGKWNGRAAMRTMILHSVVDPKLSISDLGNLPISVYNRIVEGVNEANSGDLTEAADDPNT